MLYDYGVLKSTKFDMPVIVIGNLSLGGTGKSPHTLYIAKVLSMYRTAILSRGYGRKSNGFVEVHSDSDVELVGDEPLMFKTFMPEVSVNVCEDRCEGIKRLNGASYPPDVILLDDAYQHRKLQAGFSVLLFDYQSLMKPSFLIPAGKRRDVFNRWKKADVIVVSKSPEREKINRQKIESKFADKNVFYSRYNYKYIQSFDNIDKGLDYINGKLVILVTGIADSSSMVDMISERAKLVIHKEFGDHHAYTTAELNDMQKKYTMFAAEESVYLTTAKDRTRLIPLLKREELSKWFSLEIEVEMEDSDKFEKLILSYVERTQRNGVVH
jgi:tetraacyldisaccharide 4'-kinase